MYTVQSNKIHTIPSASRTNRFGSRACQVFARDRFDCMARVHSSLANHNFCFFSILIRIEVRNEYMVKRIPVVDDVVPSKSPKQVNGMEKRRIDQSRMAVDFRVSKQKWLEMAKSFDDLHSPTEFRGSFRRLFELYT